MKPWDEYQFNMDGTLSSFVIPAVGYQKLHHSLGLVGISTTASIMGPPRLKAGSSSTLQ